MLRALLLAFLLLSHLIASDQFFILPEDKKEAQHALMELLDSARSDIKVAMFSFTYRDLAKKLRKAAERGVKVTIIFDKESNLKSKHSQIGYLAKYRNIDCRLLSGLPSDRGDWQGKMHIKLALIDGKTAALGSANWSYSAFNKNYETLLLTDSPAVIEKSKKYLKTMIQESESY